MATLDLKAYCLVQIAIEYPRKFLRFKFNGDIFEFNCLSFGLSTALFVSTKLMKPVISFLRDGGYASVIYLDNILLFRMSEQKCEENVKQMIELL